VQLEEADVERCRLAAASNRRRISPAVASSPARISGVGVRSLDQAQESVSPRNNRSQYLSMIPTSRFDRTTIQLGRWIPSAYPPQPMTRLIQNPAR